MTALAPLVAHHDVTWIASALSDEDRAVAAEGAVEETAHDGSRYRLRLVAHRPSAYDLYYNVAANPALWFVQHGLWDLKHDPGHDLGRAWEEGYVAVNRAFADAVLEELEREPGATVFFHDYHLYVAPALVRAQRPEATLAHFTHIPWVDAEAWSVLPAPIVTAIHTGLLANDVVGFHTERWRSAFLSACSSLGLDTGDTLVTAHPISIDPDEFTSLAESDEVLERERELVASRPETMILRVDRTDPSKNVVRGLEAFGLLLERRPDLRGRVGHGRAARSVPAGDPRVRRGAASHRGGGRRPRGALSGRAPAPGRRRLPSSIAAYKQFDVLLVNAIMDGLNLVAKEAPFVNARDGVVVLSVNAGAYEELGEWTIPVDPLDVEGQATALEDAVALPRAERRARLDAIRDARAHARPGARGSTPCWPTSTAPVRCDSR